MECLYGGVLRFLVRLGIIGRCVGVVFVGLLCEV